MSLYVGVDSGTQSVKAVVLNLDRGRVVAEARAPHAMIAGLPPGHMEQHPREWIAALDQVLDNLVSNAIKFSPPGRKVYLKVRQLSEWAECEVRDEGPGFTDEDKAKMFRRYHRLSARPTAGEPSTGLGLSIVHKLVVGMGGKLICESKAGEGAAFVIRLPGQAG